MSKIIIGNKQNAILNGEWAKHVRNNVGGKMKRYTSSIRRQRGRKLTLKELDQMYQ